MLSGLFLPVLGFGPEAIKCGHFNMIYNFAQDAKTQITKFFTNNIPNVNILFEKHSFISKYITG